MVYLALRKVAPKGFFQKIFWWVTKWRLLTQFPHAGVVIKNDFYGNELLHTTVFRGVHSLSKNEYCNDDWVFFHVDISDSLVKDRYFSVIGAGYDWFSLLAFVITFRFTKASWFYCYGEIRTRYFFNFSNYLFIRYSFSGPHVIDITSVFFSQFS